MLILYVINVKGKIILKKKNVNLLQKKLLEFAIKIYINSHL